MTRQELIQQIREKQSFLCVGLDTDLNKIPQCIIDEAKEKDGEDYVFRALCEFNALIIDATAPYCVAYKPNLAFYEAYRQSFVQNMTDVVQDLSGTHEKFISMKNELIIFPHQKY